MKTEKIKKLLDEFDRVIKEFRLEAYNDEWLVELVDKTRIEARAELAALKAENGKLREAVNRSKSAMEIVYNTHARPHLQRSGTHPRTVDVLAPAIQEAQAALDGKEIKGGEDDWKD